MSKRHRYHLVGVGGVGMCALAQALIAEGQRQGWDCKVQGSDRAFDRGERPEHFKKLKAAGIQLVPQDGSAVKRWHTAVVVSTAIEQHNADIAAAEALRVPIVHRSEVLAGLLHGGHGVAIGGTSGKSSTTAMLGHALAVAGRDPFVIGGAAMMNFTGKAATGHVRAGDGPVVIEADESGGTLEAYAPHVAVVTSLALDHKPLRELKPLFRKFVARAQEAVVLNVDLLPLLGPSAKKKIVSYGIGVGKVRAWDIRQDGLELTFRIGRTRFCLPMVGRYNVLNALAATAVARHLGVRTGEVAGALETYAGVERRFIVLGKSKRGVWVVDDFAHNPEKIKAAIHAARHLGGRMAAVFQPHGYGPTRLMHKQLRRAFHFDLRRDDALFLLPIYYAGGTVVRDIASEDLLPQSNRLTTAMVAPDRGALVQAVTDWAEPGDTVLVMGARDPSLGELAQAIKAAL